MISRKPAAFLFTILLVTALLAPIFLFFLRVYPGGLIAVQVEGIERATSIASDFSSQMTTWAMAAMAANALLIFNGGELIDRIVRIMFGTAAIFLMGSMLFNVMIVDASIRDALDGAARSSYNEIKFLMWLQFILIYIGIVILVANFTRVQLGAGWR